MMIKDKQFEKWLIKNKIDYKGKPKEYIVALYGEFKIEQNKG